MTANRQVSIHDLNVLVRTAQHPTIKSLDSLMGELFGQNATAIKLFKRLLHWLPYSKRADGAVYKSARDLAEEVYCSEKSVFRAKSLLESAGFEIFLKKAQGAPTNHYKLSLDKLLHKLAETFNTTIEQIRSWLKGEVTPSTCPSSSGHDVPMESAQTVPNDSVKVSQSITLQYTSKNIHKREQTQHSASVVVDKDSQDQIEEIREKLGTSTSLVQNWIQKYGIVRVIEVIEQAQVQQREGKIRKSMVGWVRSALDHNYSWQKEEKVASGRNWKNYLKTSKYAAFIEY